MSVRDLKFMRLGFAIGGCVQLVLFLVSLGWWLGEDLPFQDATPEMLAAQAEDTRLAGLLALVFLVALVMTLAGWAWAHFRLVRGAR